MANDSPIKMFDATSPLSMRMGSLEMRVSVVIVEDLGEDDFLLGRTFKREFDVLIHIRENKITTGDVDTRRRMYRKQTMGSFKERVKLALQRQGMVGASAAKNGRRHRIPIANLNACQKEKYSLSFGFQFRLLRST